MSEVPAGDPAEDYLDRLLLTLGGSPRQVRHMLAEVESHLQDAVAEGMAAGLTALQAKEAAVARMGPAHGTTGAGAAMSRPSAALIRRTALVAVGVSGAISWLMAIVGGETFLTAPFPPGSYTRADCARWLAGDPATRSCVRAMIDDHTGEIVLQSFALGILGLLVLGAYWWMRRRWRDRGTLTALPAGTTEVAGVLLAALVTVVMTGTGLGTEMIQRGVGAGHPLSLAIAALAAAIFFAIRLRRTIRLRGT
jgi:hypothetical protein